MFYYEIGRERLDSVGTQANDYDEIIAQSFKVKYFLADHMSVAITSPSS